MKRIISIGAVFVLILSACTQTPPPAEEPNSLKEVSDKVVQLLAEKNFDELAKHIHPEKGVRFSPYGTIDTKKDVILKGFELSEDETRLWGQYDGTGLPIEMSFADYYTEFIYDQDFANAPQSGLNIIFSEGNSINNIKKVYGDAEYVSYHFPGFDPETYGMDWASLRLVFEEFEGESKLVGIINDQWTI